MSSSTGKPMQKRVLVGCLPIIRDPELIAKLVSYKQNHAHSSLQEHPKEHDMPTNFTQCSIVDSDSDSDLNSDMNMDSNPKDWVHVSHPNSKSSKMTPSDKKVTSSSSLSLSSNSEHVPHFLLVSSREHPSSLILPKGGLHTGETGCCGAMRETWEEAGITGACGRLITSTENSHSIAYWYELNVHRIYSQWPEASERERVWIPISEIDQVERIRKPALKVIQHWKDHCSKETSQTSKKI